MTTGVTVSIVSHGHTELVDGLLTDLRRHATTETQLILTMNIAEGQAEQGRFGPDVIVVENEHPKGFGANHNAAFAHAEGEYFCVMNPDVGFVGDPFPSLLALLSGDDRIGVVGPKIVNPAGEVEDSGRVFPSVRLLLSKFWRRAVRRLPPSPDYEFDDGPVAVDWIGGMFMLFRSDTFAEIGGFDERYFLYYEDVDLCWRLRRAGYEVVLQPDATVVHSAQRSSWKNWRYMRWHLTSMGRFLVTQARG